MSSPRRYCSYITFTSSGATAIPDPDYTDITIVLDRSGSMESCREETIAGFNRFLDQQRALPGMASITLIQFDNQYEKHYVGIPLAEAADLTPQTYVPRSGTALLDAMGRTIKGLGRHLASMPQADRPGKVLFVTLTDGQENASRRYTPSRVMSMIRHQREQYGWQFIFLGANQDAIAAAGQLGIDRDASITFSTRRSEQTWNTLGTAMSRFRRGDDADVSFSAEEREESGDNDASDD
ncbi:MAG: vWA domain-containing protein [Phycisphaeraceae bacterium]